MKEREIREGPARTRKKRRSGVSRFISSGCEAKRREREGERHSHERDRWRREVSTRREKNREEPHLFTSIVGRTVSADIFCAEITAGKSQRLKEITTAVGKSKHES
jgi:hypothetical protein